MVRRLAIVLLLAGCRDPAPAAADAAVTSPAPSAGAEARRVEAKPEAGALKDPRCEGTSLSLLDVACEVPDAEWAEIPAPAAGALAQEAKVLADVDVVFSIVNRSSKPVVVPLRFDDERPGRSFSVVVERTGAPGIYAVGTPRAEPPPGVDAGSTDVRPAARRELDAGRAHLHSTRIVLLPGGRASATLRLDLVPTERLDRRDAGALLATSLSGAMTVHIGQLLSHLDMGDPARVPLNRTVLP